MRKHLSVLMLAARSTVYKFFSLLIVMGAAQLVLFCLALQRDSTNGLEQTIAHSRVSLVFLLCFLLLCALVSVTGCELRGSKLRYTVQRLQISEKALTLWWSAYNAACFIIFWAVELTIMLILCRIYMARGASEHVSGQTIFLAFYRSNFLRSLMPLEETSRLIRNIMLIFGLGVSSACFSYNMRHDKRNGAIILMASITTMFFVRGMGSFTSDLALSVVSLIAITVSISGMWRVQNDEA